MDAISMLKNDHVSVEKLFKQFEKAGDRAYVRKGEIVDRIIEELSAHAAIEEQLFYPVARATVAKTEDIALESLEEHHLVKWVLSELEKLAPDAERFDAKVTVLIETVRHHVKEEEQEFFPMVRDDLGRKALTDLGEAMAEARKMAPTHPHPRAPDTPPGNLVAGTAAGVADRIGDTMSGLAQGGVTALTDLIATILRRKKPRVSPTGPKATRRAATDIRSAAANATDAAIEATQEAKRVGERTTRTAKATGTSVKTGVRRSATAAAQGGEATARAAKAAVKGTSTSARKSTRRTATVAKRGATTTRRTASRAVKSTTATAKRSARKTVATAKRPARAG